MERKHLFSLSGWLALVSAGCLLVPGISSGEPSVKLRTSLDRPLIDLNSEDRKVVIKIEVEGGKVDRQERMPVNLAIVLDRSGSMSGSKLEQAKQAACYLVDQLEPTDVISLVLYDTEVQVALPAGKVGKRADKIQRMIRGIQTGGSTALYGGVDMGGRELEEFLCDERVNRVMLLSDGIANIGPSSNREIANLGNRLARKGMSVTTIGLGDDYNETLMTALAEASDANYYYVADVEELPKVFKRELGELKSIVAKEIIIRIRCPKGVRPLRVLGRPGELSKQEESIVFATLSSEQSRDLYLECEIDPEVIGKVTEIANVGAEYRDPLADRRETLGERVIVVGYSEDSELAASVVDQGIVAEAEVSRNAEEVERAIALADEGQADASREHLAKQQEKLKSAYAVAPAPQQEVLEREIESLDEAVRELERGQLSKEQRKVLTNRTWELRNAKK